MPGFGEEKAAAIRYHIHDPSTKEVLETYANRVEAWLDSRREELGYSNVYTFYSEPGYVLTQIYLPDHMVNPDNLKKLRQQLQEGLPDIAGVKLEVGERMWGGRHGDQGRRMIHVALH